MKVPRPTLLDGSVRGEAGGDTREEAQTPPPLAGEGRGEGEGMQSTRVADEVAICVQNLSKCYQIYDRPEDRLKQALVPRFQRLLGRPPTQYAREFWALKDVSFEVKKGETVGIIGRNGSGKSTLMQMICGTLTPTSGIVQTNGRIAALLELGSGFNPEFTGRENVYVNGSILGLSSEEVHEKFDEIAAFADIGGFIDQPVKTYSSGMFVRLAFAVIANVDAELLVIDEALAVGDAYFTQKCMRFLRKFGESGTILFVSHSTSAVTNLCRRAVWLDKGTVKAIGPAKETCEAYLEDLFDAPKDGKSAPSRGRQMAFSGGESPAPVPGTVSLTEKYVTKNEIKLFKFDGDATSYTTGGATITEVALLGRDGRRLNVASGLDEVRLRIVAKAHRALACVIVGFFVKDQLGQSLFGDHTYLAYEDQPLDLQSGQVVEATFDFTMPLLPNGQYSICVAVAEGDPDNNVQHHWVHDALIFTVSSPKLRYGLVGIPMREIRMSVLRSEVVSND